MLRAVGQVQLDSSRQLLARRDRKRIKLEVSLAVTFAANRRDDRADGSQRSEGAEHEEEDQRRDRFVRVRMRSNEDPRQREASDDDRGDPQCRSTVVLLTIDAALRPVLAPEPRRIRMRRFSFIILLQLRGCIHAPAHEQQADECEASGEDRSSSCVRHCLWRRQELQHECAAHSGKGQTNEE